jgi:hypothetical protein
MQEISGVIALTLRAIARTNQPAHLCVEASWTDCFASLLPRTGDSFLVHGSAHCRYPIQASCLGGHGQRRFSCRELQDCHSASLYILYRCRQKEMRLK